MNSESTADASAPAAGGGHWAVATRGEPAIAGQAMRELAASYWYPVYAWWRRVGCKATKAAMATEACFSRWIEREPPRPDQAGAGRMRDWLLKRLPAMAVAGVKPWPAPLVTIDRVWAEKLYATEPDGAPEKIFARRLALEMLEFAIETLHEEDIAAGRADDFRRLLPRLRIVAGEHREPAVEAFRLRFGSTLRVLVADIIADPREVNGELATLTDAAKNPVAPAPGIFDGLTPDELFAWGLAAPVLVPVAVRRPPSPAPAAVAPAVVAPVPRVIAPSSERRTRRRMAVAAAALLAAIAGYLAFKPEKETLSIAEIMEHVRAAQPKPPAIVDATKPTPKPNPAKPVRPKPTPSPKPVRTPVAPAPPMVATTPVPVPVPVPAPAPAPMPAQAKAPAPTPVPLSEFAKWLTDTCAEMQAAYDREVRAPSDSAVARALQQFVSRIDASIAAADASGKRDAVLALRVERQRFMNSRAVADDNTKSVPELKLLRAQWLAQFAKLDKERYDRAKALHARYDSVLAQKEARLTGQQDAGDANTLKAKRAEFAASWLVPPSGTPAATSTPVHAAPPATGRTAPVALLAKLFALNARVVVRESPNRAPYAVLTSLDLKSDKFEFYELEFRARSGGGAPVTDDDLEILDELRELHDLTINGIPVTDATIERLRACRALQRLRLENLQHITAKSFEILAALPELRSLALVNLPVGDDAIATVAQLTKLTNLRINDLPITDASLAALTAIPTLEDLEFGGGKIKITSASWENVASMRRLTRLYCKARGLGAVAAGHIARCAHLTRLKIDGEEVTDASLAPLSALTHLSSLDLGKSKITGAGFKTWPVRPALITLKLDECPGLDDNVLRAIATAFPKLETLVVTGAAGAITTAGASEIARLRQLTTLRLSGEAATDAIAAELARIETLTQLNLGKAKITDAGLAALAKLPKLGKLTVVDPPITDSALKALRRFRALKEITVGPDTQEAIYSRLRADLPGVTIRR